MSRPITDTLRNIQSGRLVDEAAARELIAAVRAGAEVPFFFGTPGL